MEWVNVEHASTRAALGHECRVTKRVSDMMTIAPDALETERAPR